MNGVPLSYVISENDNLPTAGRQYTSFVNATVYCAPLSSSYYDTDKKTSHQSLLLFITGQPSEDCIKRFSRYKYRRQSMQALCDHFPGEGNPAGRISESDRMKKYLHYKNERSLSFEMFLT